MSDLTPQAAVLTASFGPDADAPIKTPTVPRPPATPSGPTEELTEEQAEKMTSWIKEDLAKGKLSPEKAEQMFNELGRSAEQRLPDQRTDEQKELDRAFPPAKPADYTIQYFRPGENVVMTKDMEAFDKNARGWMAGAWLPRETGNSLVSAISRVLEHTRSMTPDQLVAYGENEFVKLQKVHGDKLDERLRQAGLMVHELELKTPGLKHLLKRVGDSALVANLLMGHAPIYHARRQGR